MNEIVVSIISGLCVAIPSVFATITTNKKNKDLTIYRIDKLEEKVDKHNSVIERTFKIEEDIKNIKEDIEETKGKCYLWTKLNKMNGCIEP